MERRQSDVELVLLRQDMIEMKNEVKELKDDIEELLEAWMAAKGSLRFVKWAAGIGAAGLTFWSAWKGLK